MFRVAIIGAGNVGAIRGRVIQDSFDCRVRFVADIDPVPAHRLAETMGCEATTDWRRAIQSNEVDLVVVCTPTKFHTAAVVTALRAGKHVLCEKPLARSLAEAEEVVEAAETRKLILKTGFNYRYMGHVRKAKELIDKKLLGPLYYLRCRYGHGGRPGYEQHWCTDQELSGGGVLLEQGIHVIDLVRFLLDEPTYVMAETSRFFWDFPEVEDNCFLLLKTQHARTAQIHISWTQWVNIFSLEIFGRNGYLHLTGRDGHYGPQRLVWGKRQPNHSRPEEESFEFPSPDDSWTLEWNEFIAAIHTGRKPMGSGNDSMQALRLIEAAYESSRDQQWVEVSGTTVHVGAPL
jgi:predicted dehydrogenase